MMRSPTGSKNIGAKAMNSKILGLLAAGLIAGPICAIAQSTTYTYQGDALAVAVNVSPPAGATSFTEPPNVAVGALNGFITLSAPLGDNLNNVSVTPTYVDISSGLSALFNGVFAFSTNGSGAIDGWSMSLNGNVGGPGGYTFTATSVDSGGKGGDSATMATTCTAYFPLPQAPQPFGCGSTGSNSTPGVWTSPATRVPEIDPASAATALTLLLGGIAVRRGRRTTLITGIHRV
jgi:hypothetical protein